MKIKKDVKMYINGKWVVGNNKDIMLDENPSTGNTFAMIPKCSDEDIDHAVSSARDAFESWSETSPSERSLMIRKVGDILKKREKCFIDIIVKELGMPIKYCKDFQVAGSIDEAYYFADILDNYKFEIKQKGGSIIREPFGVAAFITPWNYPLDQITIKVFPAIAAGNCVVVKPSKLTPLTGLLLAEVFQEANFPPGVFNMVTGVGSEVGNAMANHPDIDIISFTGSTITGKALGAKAIASTAKKVILELGGKSAMIILESGDFEAALDEVLDSVFLNSGQTCCAFTRLLIPASKKKEIENLIVYKSTKYVVGNPQDPSTDIGPVISQDALKKIKAYVQSGISEGASLLVGGKHHNNSTGYYINPIVFTDVTPDMTIARDEIFGPVLSVISYNSVSEAISIANDTIFGLDGSVYGNPDDAIKVARQIRSGNVHINGALYSNEFPFGGYKQSGLGREGSIYGFEEYLEIKSILY